MNNAMIPINPIASVTAVLQVPMIPSAFCTRYAGAAAVPTAGVAIATLTVSPALPVTIVENISLSAGTHAYRTPATTIETKINAAHILLNAMPQININCLISRPQSG
jgi:hypothetical protein